MCGEKTILFTRGTPIFSSILSRAEASGLGKFPRLLKTSAVAALTCLALAKSPQSAQAQSSAPLAPVFKFGVPLVGPAPASDVVVPDVCWSPGTPASKIAAYERAHSDFGNSLAPSPFRVLVGRWSRTATNGSGLKQGQPTTLTYSIVPDGTPISNGNNDDGTPKPTTPSNLQARLTQIYGDKATWLALFARASAALSAQSGLTYVYEPNDDGVLTATYGNLGQLGVRGDVRIAGRTIDGNYGVLAFNFSPDSGDMVIDTADSFYEDRRNDDRGFRNTVSHEMGHGVGLAHTCPINQTKLMEPSLTYAIDGPQFDDIRGLQRFYGDDSEEDDTVETAQDLGALNDGTVNIGQGKVVSIDDASDVDFFKFSLPANKSLSVVLRPTGDAYLEGAQNQDSSCSDGTLFDPKTVNDLGFELLKADSSGAYVSIATVNANPIGGTETFAPSNFFSGGQFLIRAFGGTVKDVQTYAMDISVSAPVIGPKPTPGPTPGPTPIPTPKGTAIRPVIDLNGPNSDGSTGQDRANANGIDATALYFYRKNDTVDAKGVVTRKSGGPQIITPPEEIVLSDISGQNIPDENKGKAIAEARVQLTPENADGGHAPDNFSPKYDQEVLGIAPGVIDNLNKGGANLSVSYDNNSQILTIKGGRPEFLDFNRGNYEEALRNVTYEDKQVAPSLFDYFSRDGRQDRVVTYVVDTDNDGTNNLDSRFAPQEPGNSKQSKPAVLTLRFADNPSLNVTTNSDVSTNSGSATYNDGQNSLREAITYANQIGGGAITFDPTVSGSINLASPLPALNAPITITGPGARNLTVNGASQQATGNAPGNSSVFQVNDTVGISGLTISGGTAAPQAIAGSTATQAATGGGIFVANGGNLTVDACTISGNSASFGGGIGLVSGSSLTLTNSTISGNSGSQAGGGIYLGPNTGGAAGRLNISNSTISGNSGTGITQASGNSSVTLTTVANNASTGILVSGGRMGINNTIVSGNASDNDVAANGGTFNSGGYNIVGGGNAAASFTNNDRSNVTPSRVRLSALSNNGGPTDTHALLAGSPAIDRGNPNYANPPATDQRGEGFPRVVKVTAATPVIDVGAFEKQDNKPIVNPMITPSNPTTNQVIKVRANSDATNLTYDFSVNGNLRQSGTQNTFDLSKPNNGDRGDQVSVVVTATSAGGTTTGSDSVIVANSAPSFRVTITATNPAPNQNVVVPLTRSVLKANASNVADPDGNSLTYRYVWKVNGQVLPQERGNTIDLSKPGNGDRDDVVSVEVTGSDGNDPRRNTPALSATRTASVTVSNTPPVGQPISFNVNAGATVRVLLQASDVDTKQPTRTDSRSIDTQFRFVLAAKALLGVATIEVNSDGRSVLVYTANKTAKGRENLRLYATDQATSKSASSRSQPYFVTANIIAAPASSSRSSAPVQSSNPSAGNS